MTTAQSRYYRSLEWRELRARILAERPLCERCGKRWSRQVHHLSYDAGNAPEVLQALCRRCHAALHGKIKRLW